MDQARVRIAVIGLACAGGDGPALERALARVPGVKEVYVNPVTESAYLTVDIGSFQTTDALAIIAAFGYETIVELTSGGPR